MGKKYWYEMKREFGPGAQPKGVVEFKDDVVEYTLIAYDRKLTNEEVNDYELKEYTK